MLVMQIPPATTVGHRAELWNVRQRELKCDRQWKMERSMARLCPPSPPLSLSQVNKWFAEVGVRVVAADEHCTVRLEDLQSRELFAECPILPDRPLTTAVEPVIDSSRYFVLRIGGSGAVGRLRLCCFLPCSPCHKWIPSSLACHLRIMRRGRGN